MLGVLLTRRWLTALAAALAVAVACVFLGRWQWHRYEVKHARAERISAHYGARPVPLAAVLPSVSSPMPLAREWTRVQVSGRYAASRLMLVRNRPLNGTYGYEVLLPLDVAGGGTLLVDRGWVPNARTANQLPVVPATPSESVTVTGWLRLGEPELRRPPAPGQLASIALAQAAHYSGRRLYDAYAVLDGERTAAGRVPARPVPPEQPDTDEGPHLAYAFQWWFGAVAGFGLVFLGVRRETLDRGAVAARAGAAGSAPAGGSALEEPVLVPARPRKHRIWDDEDE